MKGEEMSASREVANGDPLQRILLTVDSKANGQPVPKLPRLPRARYVDEAFLAAEIEQVFKKSWLHLAHVSEFEKEGSYKVFELPSLGPVILIRGENGSVRAFRNACAHRGAAVLKDSAGCRKRMSCPYHGWTYDLRGQLVGVSSPNSFPGLDMAEYSLPQLRCESWGGLLFVNFDEAAPPLIDWLGTAAIANDQVEDVPGQPLRMLFRKHWDLDCNWKVIHENFNEGYHIDFVHGPSITDWVDQTKLRTELYGNGCFTQYNYYRPQKENVWDAAPQNLETPIMPSMEGRTDFDERHAAIQLFPNVLLVTAKQAFHTTQALPLGVDRCRFTVATYVRDWGDGPKPAAWDTVEDGVTNVVLEDLELVAALQRSIKADPDRDIPLGGYEIPLFHINAALDKMIGPGNFPARCAVPQPDFLDQWITR
jgi:phenylpropionate dioxygenase-like ring-hydroxylating dioxygenase large terminal subunit